MSHRAKNFGRLKTGLGRLKTGFFQSARLRQLKLTAIGRMGLKPCGGMAEGAVILY
jgi:hypothetical protein